MTLLTLTVLLAGPSLLRKLFSFQTLLLRTIITCSLTDGDSSYFRAMRQSSDLLVLLSCQLGFLIHIVIEIPASFNFYMFPSRQLGTYTPTAHPVIRQYAALLFASVLVAMVFVRQPVTDTSGKVAGALAIYHVAPSIRSVQRLTRQAQRGERLILSEAFLYLLVHMACCIALLYDARPALFIEPAT